MWRPFSLRSALTNLLLFTEQKQFCHCYLTTFFTSQNWENDGTALWLHPHIPRIYILKAVVKLWFSINQLEKAIAWGTSYLMSEYSIWFWCFPTFYWRHLKCLTFVVQYIKKNKDFDEIFARRESPNRIQDFLHKDRFQVSNLWLTEISYGERVSPNFTIIEDALGCFMLNQSRVKKADPFCSNEK